jgi:polyketide synthase PksM
MNLQIASKIIYKNRKQPTKEEFMSNSHSFHCSEKKLFTPLWANKPTNDTLADEVKTLCFVLPANQPQLKEQLNLLAPWVPVFELENEQVFETILSLCQTTSLPHLVFVSHSTWSHTKADSEHVLFLKWLQSLKRLTRFKLSVVALNALKSANNNAVTNPLDAVYLGLTQTFAKEMPNAVINSIHVEKLTQHTLKKLDTLKLLSPLSPIFMDDESCSVKELQPLLLNELKTGGFKHKGCYLILGGTGGLGSLLADYLCDTYQAQVILTSRRAALPEVMRQFTNPNIILEQVDLTCEEEMKDLLQRHQNIDGIIHSALVLDDVSIMAMPAEKLVSVLAPKVQGTVNLIKTIAHRQFDFVLFFSSIQSFIANAGQANYTAACLAKDALAEMIKDVFHINTHIINWGLWGEHGIVANDFYRQRMQTQEISSITAEEGLAVIEQCLQHNLPQVIMVKGSQKALENMGINTSSSRRLLPSFDKEQNKVKHNKAMMDALDRYSKYYLSRVAKPQTISSKYEKLWEALSHISYADSPDRNQLLALFPELKGHLNLIDACLNHLPAILTGETCPLSIMFPQGSFALVEPVYRNNPVADYYNEGVASAVECYVNQAAQQGRTVRILEIGAGTGSTSEKVLPRLKGKAVHYVYSDLSHAFLNKARKEFAAYDFIEYKIVNIEQPPSDVEPFDIIIATNVIHATSSIGDSARNLFQLLRDNGVLLLNEITSRQDFATLTFGLTDGWWLSQDEMRIPYSPLLDLATWKKILAGAGFTECYDHGDFGQHVIEAHRGTPHSVVQREELKQDAPPTAQTINQSATVRSNEAYIWLKQLICKVMHMSEHEIQADTPFSEYGIDSLISLELIKPMTDKVGYVPATLLFEYPTLNKLSTYFSEHFTAVFQSSQPEPKSEQQSNIPYLTQLIRSTISQILHTPENELDANTPFSELGIDSLISLEIVTAIQKKTGYLPATILFEYPTITLLADYINEHNSLTEAIATSEVVTLPEVTQPAITKPVTTDRQDAIAIVGIAGKFPGADNCDALWDLLSKGEDAFKPIPSERWIKDKDSKSYTQTAALINDISSFDHQFFNIAPIDAERMDPQERHFLQTTYHAIEDAGLCMKELSGQNIGCYVGVMNHGYSWLTPRNPQSAPPSSLFWSIANRISYQFNWHGPSFAVDSACSSSLTALHTAITALHQGDCEMAVVGGVNLICHPRQIDVLCQLHMLSPSEQCKPFGQNADGFVDGEGIISIVIMPYQKALEKNLNIYGLIRGSAINAGGKAHGYSAPNPKAQSELIKKALARAKLEAKDIHMVEAHGTGTELGDPIEIRALTEAYGSVDKQSIALGSIKGNLGHLESAAGLASVVKVVLQMKHKMRAPSLHSAIENPHLQLQNTPFFISKTLAAYQQNPFRTAISSFGAGGANAHVIIESCEQKNKQAESFPHYFFPLSAHSYGALQKELINLRNVLLHAKDELAALSYAYCCVRSPQKIRLGLVVESRDELIKLCEVPLLTHRRVRALSPAPHSNSLPSALMSSYLNKGKSNKQDASDLLSLFDQGMDIDFRPLFQSNYPVTLPAYPFDGFKHWLDAQETRISHRSDIVNQHVILGQPIAPAALSLSMIYEQAPFQSLTNVLWKKVITAPESLHVVQDGSHYQIKEIGQSLVYSQAELATPAGMKKSGSFVHAHQSKTFSAQEIYQHFKTKGYDYGSNFQVILQASVSGNQVHSVLCVDKDWGYTLSPALIDGALQTAILTELDNRTEDKVKVPFLIEQITVFDVPELCQPVYCSCIPKSANSYDIELCDVDGNVLIELKGVVSIVSTTDKLFEKAVEPAGTMKSIKMVELNP